MNRLPKRSLTSAPIGRYREGIVSQRLGSPYRSGRSKHWVKVKNPAAPAVKREAEEDWGNKEWRCGR
jgi:ATP-dependent DNA ligase